MYPVIITVAGVGAELTKKDTPFLPASPDEIIEEAVRISERGAAIFHLHVRDERGRPTIDPNILRRVVKATRQRTDLIVQISTGGSIGDSYADRLKTLVPGVEMGSLTLGSVNFGGDVFLNPRPFIEKLAGKMLKLGVKPELEIFDVAMMEYAHHLLRKGLLSEPLHFNIILGGPGWLAATVENLEFILRKIPEGATWSASGVGRGQLPMIEYAVSHGGHVRTGLEDNIFIRKGELAKGNVELVDQAVELARKFGRSVATPAEARKILGISPRLANSV